jgi:hypothetical protein
MILLGITTRTGPLSCNAAESISPARLVRFAKQHPTLLRCHFAFDYGVENPLDEGLSSAPFLGPLQGKFV